MNLRSCRLLILCLSILFSFQLMAKEETFDCSADDIPQDLFMYKCNSYGIGEPIDESVVKAHSSPESEIDRMDRLIAKAKSFEDLSLDEVEELRAMTICYRDTETDQLCHQRSINSSYVYVLTSTPKKSNELDEAKNLETSINQVLLPFTCIPSTSGEICTTLKGVVYTKVLKQSAEEDLSDRYLIGKDFLEGDEFEDAFDSYGVQREN